MRKRETRFMIVFIIAALLAISTVVEFGMWNESGKVQLEAQATNITWTKGTGGNTTIIRCGNRTSTVVNNLNSGIPIYFSRAWSPNDK